ncbi:hypothetical protein Zmor_011411 [Zophobas morio]|uniref:Reverse transcriptase domain-containing protein n=1 Tax=Zophobas morio TaxID=2755281 RepID=A0AA38MKW9_9CUCU|nr:hypothetical protein Zmor_011411 [Zophobas morio]
MYLDSNYNQLVHEPTRFRLGNTPSLLDLILINDTTLLSDINISSPIGISDHAVIESNIQITLVTASKHRKELYKIIDHNQVSFVMDHLNWEAFYSISEVQTLWNVFKNTIHSVVANNSKTKVKQSNSTKPWISGDLLRRVKYKRKLWKKYKLTKKPEDFELHRSFANILSKDLNKARQIYENSLLNRGPKAVYKYTKRKLCSKISLPTVKNNECHCSKSNSESAEILAEFFASTYTNEDSQNLPNSPPTSSYLDTIEINEAIVYCELLNLSEHSAPGPDNICGSFLKKYALQLAKPLAHIMSQSLLSTSLPSDWLKSSVTPIFKKGDKTDRKNYRPISLTAVCCKLMERILCKRIIHFAIHEGIVPDEQHGFLPGRSTETCLLYCLDKWTKAIDRGDSVDIVYIDFQKAFDKVPHRRLIHKLRELGIKGNLLKWISAFLSERVFYVRVGDSLSNNYAVKSGVPQGSVLGPVLFVLYISDLSRLLKSDHAFYADDLKIFNYPNSSYNILIEDLNTVLQWCDLWLIPIKKEKCVILHLGAKNPCLNYRIGNDLIKAVDKYVDLGITIQSDLKWSHHSLKTVKKTNITMYLLRKAFQSLSKESFLTLYKSYVRPQLEYASVVWCPFLQKDIELLERAQRRATKTVASLHNLPYSQRLQELALCTLSERRSRNDLVWTFTILKGYLGVDLSPLFNINSDERLRGHSLKLRHNQYKSKIRENFLSNRVFTAWNALPANTINSHSINTFKAKLH